MNKLTRVIDVYFAFVHQPWTSQRWHTQLQRIPKNLQSQVLGFRRWQDQHMALMGKLLLLEGLKSQGYGADCLERVEVDENGRPFIADGVDFNISHSGGAVLCAISRHAKVGIDVEVLRCLQPDHFTLCMTHQQIEAFHRAADPAKALLELWVAKESVAKANGVGLGIDFRKMICSPQSILIDETVYQLYPLDLDPAYLCCVATTLTQCQIKLHHCASLEADDVSVA